MARYLSKSDFKVARTCPTKLYYKKLGYPSVNDEDPYLMTLAEGGYMVEKIAKLRYPEGLEIVSDNDHESAAKQTIQALSADSVTLFEATLISGDKLARVDILRKKGNEFHLIEVKAKSYDSKENAAAVANGLPSVFWTGQTRKNKRIASEWLEYLEDVAFQVHTNTCRVRRRRTTLEG